MRVDYIIFILYNQQENMMIETNTYIIFLIQIHTHPTN